MAVIALGALFALPTAAQASVFNSAPAPIGAIANLHAGEDDGNGGGGQSGSQDDGDQSSATHGTAGDKDDSFVVPPVVGHTEDKTAVSSSVPVSPKKPSQVVPVDAVPRVRSGNPQVGEAIQVDRVVPNVKTPTDLFVDTAVLGLGAIASGALVLGGVVGARAIKARRSGEKFDYFYGDK
jgi:hypothetical protein